MRSIVAFTAFLLALTHADVYFHSPRGSNNRLDGNGRNRRNANRLFDSQNNDRGGYNVGSLYYYTGSVIPIEWTNQHSCSDDNNNCELVIQYMCGPKVRDGTTTRTIPDRPHQCRNKDCNTDLRYGMHEDYNYYKRCKTRMRNANLFTADQKLRGMAARYTRQNPNGNRRGYECPEERDYYPYWGPSDWKDIVVFTKDTSRCNYYQQESQNVKDRYECRVESKYLDMMERRRKVVPITQESCENLVWPVDGKMVKIGTWIKVPAHGISTPECKRAPWSRDNHLGNGMGGFPNTYNWTAPDIAEENCILRIRYNISTNDFDSWNTNADKNGDSIGADVSRHFGLQSEDAKKRGYIFKNNPEVQVIGDQQLSSKLTLRLAINTAQYGRTFQDRSHTFAIRKRPGHLLGKRILNVNVRGKRGNIVQVYPAVEYDFLPNQLQMDLGDYVHFQWTGSNQNPGNNNGQGFRGSDRSNIVPLRNTRFAVGSPGLANPTKTYGHWATNYPEHAAKAVFLGLERNDMLKLAYLEPGQFLGDLNELNDAGTYFDLGPRQVTRVGTYYYMCTRNNNFSNRSQKGKIIVREKSQNEIQGQSEQEHFHDGSQSAGNVAKHDEKALQEGEPTEPRSWNDVSRVEVPNNIEQENDGMGAAGMTNVAEGDWTGTYPVESTSWSQQDAAVAHFTGRGIGLEGSQDLVARASSKNENKELKAGEASDTKQRELDQPPPPSADQRERKRRLNDMARERKRHKSFADVLADLYRDQKTG